MGADVESVYLEGGKVTDEDDQELAFPGTDARGFVSTGMTLRDWFAGQALAGLWPTIMIDRKYLDDDAYECAIAAYKIADAMMEARKK